MGRTLPFLAPAQTHMRRHSQKVLPPRDADVGWEIAALSPESSWTPHSLSGHQDRTSL